MAGPAGVPYGSYAVTGPGRRPSLRIRAAPSPGGYAIGP